MTIKDNMSPLDIWLAFSLYVVEWENFIDRPRLLGAISALRGFPGSAIPYEIPYQCRGFLEGYLENCLPDYREEALFLYGAWGGYNDGAYRAIGN